MTPILGFLMFYLIMWMVTAVAVTVFLKTCSAERKASLRSIDENLLVFLALLLVSWWVLYTKVPPRAYKEMWHGVRNHVKP